MYKGGYTPDNQVIQRFWKVNFEILIENPVYSAAAMRIAVAGLHPR